MSKILPFRRPYLGALGAWGRAERLKKGPRGAVLPFPALPSDVSALECDRRHRLGLDAPKANPTDTSSSTREPHRIAPPIEPAG